MKLPEFFGNTEITSIHYRAQDVQPGGLFVAIPGLKTDGGEYIDMALSNGAVAIVTQKRIEGVKQKIQAVLEVENPRKALAALAAAFYGHPSESLVVIGITGTNGKTTTTYLIERILAQAGYRVGVIGTINYRYSGKTFPNPMTTPESLDLQRMLAQMKSDGVTHVVMEVSSHAIDLHRIDHCWFDVGIFTNLTQDHLDYHKDMESYRACKLRFFTEHLPAGPKQNRATAVINTNHAVGEAFSRLVSIPCLTVGVNPAHTIVLKNFRHDLNGMFGTIATPLGSFDFHSMLVGAHNAENILCAVGAGVALNLSLEVIKAGIEASSVVPGRLEPVFNNKGRFVYVDYAHTPDALENVLSALRPMATCRIICVFGCGGDRDKGKRPKMGEIAGRLSDLTIITSDNPRSESPMDIIHQILPGVRQSCPDEYTPMELSEGFDKKGYTVEPDRKSAIRLAVTASHPGDIILIAGKGHETYQIIGNQTFPFNDKIIVQEVLNNES